MQRAILNSFLLSYIGTCQSVKEVEDNSFILDLSIFKTKLEKRIAEKINEETNKDKAYSVLDVQIEESMSASKIEKVKQEYIEIITYSPLPLDKAKILHDRLVSRKKMGDMR